MAALSVNSPPILSAYHRFRLVHRRLSRHIVLVVLSRFEICHGVSRPRHGAGRTIVVSPLRLSFWPASSQQSHHQLQQFLPKPGNDVFADDAGIATNYLSMEIH